MASFLRKRKVALIIVGSVLLVSVVVVSGFLLPLAFAPATPKATPLPRACPKAHAVAVGKITVPEGPIAGYCQPQLIIATNIIEAGRASDAPLAAQEIAVMTGIGESGLRNLDFGDTAGPDSRGVFQQRGNWGPLAERMNPYRAAKAFYGRLLSLPRWQTLTPTHAAHAVQGNADAEYYTQFYQRAQVLVATLSERFPTPTPAPTIPAPTIPSPTNAGKP